MFCEQPIAALVKPTTSVRDSHPLANDVWDQIREERRAMRRDQDRSQRRIEDLWDAWEYAQNHRVYSRIQSCGSCEEDVSEADFNVAKHHPEENKAERELCQATIARCRLQIDRIEAQHPEMTAEMWKEMDRAGAMAYYRHTNFAIDAITSFNDASTLIRE